MEGNLRTFTSGDGLEIAYRTWGPERDEAPVVLHHGMAVDGEQNWVRPGVVEALAATGRRIVAIDARGHGSSAKPHDPARYGEARMADDVERLFDVLGAERPDLVGYSMGSVVSLMVAARPRSRVRRLVIGAVGGGVVKLGGVTTAQGRRITAAALRADDPDTITEPTARALRDFADLAGCDRLALAAHAEVMWIDGLDLDRITAPTLLLAGVDDPLALQPELLTAAIPNAELRMIPADHLMTVAHPEYREAVVGFLAG